MAIGCSSVTPAHAEPIQRSTTFLEGRKYHNRDQVAYLLPDDNEEDARLARQHRLLKLLCGSNFDSPVVDALEQGILVLDSGCATGCFTFELGNEYPNSTFHGIDISLRVQEAIKPPNCEFHIHSVTDDPIFPDNHFGFIHQQLLILALSSSDWEKAVANLMRQLKPGGWIELHEMVTSKCENGGPRMNLLLNSVSVFAQETKGLDLAVAMKLDLLLQDAGAINISSRKVLYPLNHSGEVGRLAWYISRGCVD
ncbi:hypothetical protein LRAMOSA09433 [Lichtheimia ramosa]|uniref:Methyltransferase domain-containing protein n=1 Tax=Lichtheimia ramosa TaxID=688394 RepID=A0A077WHR0_9FUNG|nr:hypothetical protein LRAMOSA09433 [Lichtheimia ramosa]